MPVFYEALPVLAIYLHHVKNFRDKSEISSLQVEQDSTEVQETATNVSFE